MIFHKNVLVFFIVNYTYHYFVWTIFSVSKSLDSAEGQHNSSKDISKHKSTKIVVKPGTQSGHIYSRTSIIRPSMNRISGLTDPKPCLPTFSLKVRSTMSDNTAFYTFSETINSGASSIRTPRLSDWIVCLPLGSDN